MSNVTVGLIGAGRIGRIHADVLSNRVANASIRAVYDVHQAGAAEAAAQYNIPIVAESVEQILGDDTIDAVYICSSTDTHVPLIIQAAQAGKEIFCEKPIALSLPSIDEALAAVDEAGVKLQVGFNRRFHNNFKRIHELVAEGRIGDPHMVRITSRDSAPPPPGYLAAGGIFVDMTIHDFDMARYLIGRDVTEVYATGVVLIDPALKEAGDVDTAVVVMTYEGGAICTIENSREAVYGYDQRVEVFGNKGTLISDNNTPNNTQLWTTAGLRSDLPHFGFLELYMQSYIDESLAFIDSLLNDTDVPVTGIDGRYPLVMGLAARRSLAENRPVKLAEIEAEVSS